MTAIDMNRIAPHLRPVEPGLYLADDAPRSISYPAGGNAVCRQLEDDSFWFSHRNAIILDAIVRFPPPGPVVDVGGGNGFVARAIQEAGHPTVLVEPGPEGARNARARGVEHVVAATLEDARLRPGSFGGAGLFDVIEHVENDVGLLEQVHALLSSGGRAYVTVPAHRALWSHADVHAGHHRRYTRRALTRVATRAGFEVERASHFFAYLVAPILTMRAIPHRLGCAPEDRNREAAREHHGSTMKRRVVDALSQLERRTLRRVDLRVGSSLLAVLRKR